MLLFLDLTLSVPLSLLELTLSLSLFKLPPGIYVSLICLSEAATLRFEEGFLVSLTDKADTEMTDLLAGEVQLLCVEDG